MLLLQETNQARLAQGLPALKSNAVLEAAALNKARDMAAKEYFAHTSPEGLTPWYWFKQVGYSYKYAGENLAVDFNNFAQVVPAWLNSPSHRANLLNSSFTEVGIAAVKGTYQGHETYYIVQMFGTPKTSQVATVSNVVPKTQISTGSGIPTPTPTAPASAPLPEKTISIGSGSGTSAPQPTAAVLSAKTSSLEVSKPVATAPKKVAVVSEQKKEVSAPSPVKVVEEAPVSEGVGTAFISEARAEVSAPEVSNDLKSPAVFSLGLLFVTLLFFSVIMRLSAVKVLARYRRK